MRIDHIWEETFSAALIETLRRIASHSDGDKFTVEADHIKDMSDLFFSTSIGRELAYLKNRIVHFNIDWIEFYS